MKKWSGASIYWHSVWYNWPAAMLWRLSVLLLTIENDSDNDKPLLLLLFGIWWCDDWCPVPRYSPADADTMLPVLLTDGSATFYSVMIVLILITIRYNVPLLLFFVTIYHGDDSDDGSIRWWCLPAIIADTIREVIAYLIPWYSIWRLPLYHSMTLMISYHLVTMIRADLMIDGDDILLLWWWCDSDTDVIHCRWFTFLTAFWLWCRWWYDPVIPVMTSYRWRDLLKYWLIRMTFWRGYHSDTVLTVTVTYGWNDCVVWRKYWWFYLILVFLFWYWRLPTVVMMIWWYGRYLMICEGGPLLLRWRTWWPAMTCWYSYWFLMQLMTGDIVDRLIGNDVLTSLLQYILLKFFFFFFFFFFYVNMIYWWCRTCWWYDLVLMLLLFAVTVLYSDLFWPFCWYLKAV